MLFEQYGPGCIYNFVQHRYITSEEPVFRFYFDNDTEPRFELRPIDFGDKYPFVSPLADKFIGPYRPNVGHIRVVRSFVPMPFTDCAEVSVQNKGAEDRRFLFSAVSCTGAYSDLYRPGSFGHFRTSPYYPKTHTPGADSVIARLSPVHGHVVGSIITGYGIEEGARADCEGDARIHFDGLRTPCIESDGSESYSCYGWGFVCPPQSNPASGYDGKDIELHVDWSMTRLLPGEVYPFNEKLHFGIESFLYNNDDMFHSGAVFYYGENGSLMEKTAEYTNNEETLTARFEGDDDDIDVTLQGDRGKEICLSIRVSSPDELLFRRVSDQMQRGQYARVYLNGKLLPQPWYCPDGNPYLRWLEDEYRIPGKILLPNDVNEVRIVPCGFEGIDSFNQFGISVYEVRYAPEKEQAVSAKSKRSSAPYEQEDL